MKKKIIIVSGDPNSINSEIIFKSLKKIPHRVRKNIILISNVKLLNDQFKELKYDIKLKKVRNIFENVPKNTLKVLNINLNYKNAYNVEQNESSKFVLKSLNMAHDLALNKYIAGIINCPIDKRLLNKANTGVTEYLASKCAVKNGSEVMIIKSNKLMVSPITTHLKVKSISKKIKKDIIIKKVKTINNWYKKYFKRNPRIAVLGLNPHNGELRKNSEEKKIIIPALNKLSKLNNKIKGPFVADTIFISDFKNYDVIVGMYHDQVLAPFKSLFKFDAINLTLGLKYTRVSPDHGVAKDMILKKKSNYKSMLNCIKFIHHFEK